MKKRAMNASPADIDSVSFDSLGSRRVTKESVDKFFLQAATYSLTAEDPVKCLKEIMDIIGYKGLMESAT